MKTTSKLKTLAGILTLFIFIACGSDSESDGGPTLVNRTTPEPTTGQGGSLATFAIKGDYLYTVDHEDLNVFSIQNPDQPVLVNSTWVGFEIETLFGYKDFLFIGSRNGMFIFSLEDPEQPRNRSTVEHFTACDPVVANDSLAFVTLHSARACNTDVNQLEIYDIRDSDNPKLLSTKNLVEPKGLGLYHNYLIICDDYIKIFDINKVAGGVEFVTSLPKEAFDVIIQEDLLLAVGNQGVYQYSLSTIEDSLAVNYLSTVNF